MNFEDTLSSPDASSSLPSSCCPRAFAAGSGSGAVRQLSAGPRSMPWVPRVCTNAIELGHVCNSLESYNVRRRRCGRQATAAAAALIVLGLFGFWPPPPATRSSLLKT